MWNLSALVCLYTLASRTISFTDQAKVKFCIICSQSQQEMNEGGVPRGWQVKTEGVLKRCPGPVSHFTQQIPLNWNVPSRRKRHAHEFKKVKKKKKISQVWESRILADSQRSQNRFLGVNDCKGRDRLDELLRGDPWTCPDACELCNRFHGWRSCKPSSIESGHCRSAHADSFLLLCVTHNPHMYFC